MKAKNLVVVRAVEDLRTDVELRSARRACSFCLRRLGVQEKLAIEGSPCDFKNWRPSFLLSQTGPEIFFYTTWNGGKISDWVRTPSPPSRENVPTSAPEC